MASGYLWWGASCIFSSMRYEGEDFAADAGVRPPDGHNAALRACEMHQALRGDGF